MAIPNKQLVGQNASITDGVYTDDYIAALNKFATVDEVFRENKEAIAKGEMTPVATLIMGTLGKTEYELHLVSLVMTAAEAGEWRAVERKKHNQYDGLDAVVKNNFGHVTEFEGKTFLLPSAMYIVYCNERNDS